MKLQGVWLVFINILVFTTVSGNDQNDYVEFGFWDAGTSFIDSILKFKDDVKNFFHINLNKVEQSRRQFKEILQKLFGGAQTKILGQTVVKNQTVVSNNSESVLRRSIPEDKFVPLKFIDLASSHGYDVLSHAVVSKDGYILTLHKIISKRNLTAYKKEIILLHHGLLGSSEDWILLGPDKALPYILINAGYEVWLTNSRGNKYSKTHITRTKSDTEFWDFSWHEIGQYDLAATIDFIKARYKSNVKLHFIGYSMGATALLVLLSGNPHYNLMLTSAVLLAPLAFMYDVKGPLRLLAQFYFKHSFDSLSFAGLHEFVPFESFGFPLLEKYCKGNDSCNNSLLLMANGGQEISDERLKYTVLTHVPSGGSMKTVIHYIQLINSGKFQMFDCGVSENQKRYGMKSPPIYKLKDVVLPIAVFSSSDDWLSTVLDVHSLVSNLPNFVMHHVVKRHDFSHTDFVWAEDAHVLIYYVMLDLFKVK